MKDNIFQVSRKTLTFPLLFFVGFVAIALWRWLATGKVFYLYNFTYIGGAIALGIFLNDSLARPYKQWGRRIAQLLIGLYMLGYLGFFNNENMQIEGFFFYLFQGIFAGATLHYAIAKIFGPLIVGRGWCGWACWTAMILDFLPWKRPQQGRIRYAGILRYVHFGLSLTLVGLLFFLFEYTLEKQSHAEIYWMLFGNALYYMIAISLAAGLKDNRAFCKYVCPIPTTQKLTSRFAVVKMAVNTEKCIKCGLCEQHCPMGIQILRYASERKRILSTECIFCATCANICPKDAITTTTACDVGTREYLF